MARDIQRCPSCGAVVPLSGTREEDTDIQCPECGAWYATRSFDGADASSTQSRTGLWIALSLGGAFLVLLLVCGGIGAVVMMVGKQRAQMQQAFMQSQIAFQAQAAIFVPPTEFPPQTEDYAEARKHFKTKLLEEGPSPQAWLQNQMVVPADVTEMEYKSGKLQLSAWVSRDPGDGQKKPAVLYLHNGFAFGLDDWQQAQPFRDAGYVVMTPMRRGENGLDGSYSMFYDEVDDVLAAADALAKLPYVDGKRLYLAGHSTGATLTQLTAMTSSRFRAAGSFSGSPDQVNWMVVVGNLGGFRGNQGDLIPFDAENQKEFHMRSPLAFPESFKCPIRLYFGNEETYFKATNEKLAESAKKKKLDVEAVEVPGNHMTAVPQAMQKCIEFFAKNGGAKEP